MESSDTAFSLRANHERRSCDVAPSAVLVLLPVIFPPFSGSSTSKTTAHKRNSNQLPAERTDASASRPHPRVTRSTFLPHWSRLPPTSSEKVPPIPGLQTRAEGGKEVAGNRDGERRGSRRAWRTGRTGAAVWLRLLQPRLHVSRITRRDENGAGRLLFR